jgi:hypothetical protein
MTQYVGFRCTETLNQAIKKLASKLGCSKTDAILLLIERGFESLNIAQTDVIGELNQRLDLVTRLQVQTLSVTNPIGELAGESVMNNAEQDYHDLLKQLGINQ